MIPLYWKCEWCGEGNTPIAHEIHLRECKEYQKHIRPIRARKQLKKSLEKLNNFRIKCKEK